MHTFDARRVDENFVERTRQRHFGELAAFELDRDQRFDVTVFVGLIEIGTDRRLHRVDEQPQDAVFIEALDLLQLFVDARDDSLLFAVAILRRFRTRIETRVKQFDDIGGNRMMLDQRRPHVVLRIGHTDLAQETRQRADQRHVAPGQAAGQRQRVVTVVLGAAAHHHQKRGFKPAFGAGQIDHAAVMAFQQHVVEPDFVAVLARRGDQISALVDHPETHVFQHGNAFRQRQRTGETPHFQADRLLLFLEPVMEIDIERAPRAQTFDHADIAGRDGGRIGFLEARGKTLRITCEQFARLGWRIDQ